MANEAGCNSLRVRHRAPPFLRIVPRPSHTKYTLIRAYILLLRPFLRLLSIDDKQLLERRGQRLAAARPHDNAVFDTRAGAG